MRPIFTLAGAAAAALLATRTMAGPAAVTVSIGADLASHTQEYGQRELDWLANDLQQSVERAIARSGGLPDGAQLELVISDARPNRPTMQQMNRTPGLSMESFSIGGATVDGTLTLPDGRTQAVHYRWYETDIREAQGSWTWTDAHTAFDRVARRVARGEDLASR